MFGFSAVVEPTGDYPIAGSAVQIFGVQKLIIA
jgi:hypothetical protein